MYFYLWLMVLQVVHEYSSASHGHTLCLSPTEGQFSSTNGRGVGMPFIKASFSFSLFDSVLTPFSRYPIPENSSYLLADQLPRSQHALQLSRSNLRHVPITTSPPSWKNLNATFPVWLIKLSGRHAMVMMGG